MIDKVMSDPDYEQFSSHAVAKQDLERKKQTFKLHHLT